MEHMGEKMVSLPTEALEKAGVVPVKDIKQVVKANLAILELARRKALENDTPDNNRSVQRLRNRLDGVLSVLPENLITPNMKPRTSEKLRKTKLEVLEERAKRATEFLRERTYQ